MRRFLANVLAAGMLAAPLLAGALILQVDDLQSHPDAVANKAVVAFRMGACVEPEKTTATATATGMVDGKRQTVALHVMHLSDPNTFALTQEWPRTGTWVVSLSVSNPNYKDYAPSVVIPVKAGTAAKADAMSYSHPPTDGEINSALKNASL